MIGIPLGLLTAKPWNGYSINTFFMNWVETGRVSGRFIGTIITAMCAGTAFLITITVFRP